MRLSCEKRDSQRAVENGTLPLIRPSSQSSKRLIPLNNLVRDTKRRPGWGSAGRRSGAASAKAAFSGPSFPEIGATLGVGIRTRMPLPNSTVGQRVVEAVFSPPRISGEKFQKIGLVSFTQAKRQGWLGRCRKARQDGQTPRIQETRTRFSGEKFQKFGCSLPDLRTSDVPAAFRSPHAPGPFRTH